MIHKEGYPTILLSLLFSIIIIFLARLVGNVYLNCLAYTLALFLMVIVLQFFRNPGRYTLVNQTDIYAPADGKVVVIEEVDEPEYLKTKCIQISVFMSPLNVHVNRYPLSGVVKYVKYHAGLYLFAWNPKSSTENERTTIAVQHQSGKTILFRQIAGALARRIVHYAKEGDTAVQGQEFGFIKFGSRVDVFVPLGTKINVTLGQKVRGGESVLAVL